MRVTGTVICMFFCCCSFGQVKGTYYDYQWKPCDSLNARFYGTLQKTDSGWLRHDYYINGIKLQMKALYQDSACKIKNGYAYYFYPNGNLSRFENMIENKREGICMGFYSNGYTSDSADYHNGRPKGDLLIWHRNGYPSDSLTHVNDSIDIAVSWFDNGNPSEAGKLLRGKKIGKWKFFHKNGNPSAIEVYDNDKMISRELFKEDGSPQSDTTGVNRKVGFKGDITNFKKYLESKLYWPTGYRFETGTKATVVVRMNVNEEGDVEDVEMEIPFYPAFDDIAIKTLRHSPKWIPARSHNRNIKTSIRQPLTFMQDN